MAASNTLKSLGSWDREASMSTGHANVFTSLSSLSPVRSSLLLTTLSAYCNALLFCHSATPLPLLYLPHATLEKEWQPLAWAPARTGRSRFCTFYEIASVGWVLTWVLWCVLHITLTRNQIRGSEKSVTFRGVAQPLQHPQNSSFPSTERALSFLFCFKTKSPASTSVTLPSVMLFFLLSNRGVGRRKSLMLELASSAWSKR